MEFKPLAIAILGRQPKLGIAELESLYGAEHVKPYSPQACFLDIPTDNIDFERLGGSLRLARVLSPLPSTNWKDIESYLLKTTPEHSTYIDGKITFGISTFGIKTSPNNVARTALSVKKALKAVGKSVRMVPHKDLSLGTAVVLHNHLTSKNAWELLVVSDGKTVYLAQTTRVQNIDLYSARDQARPHRDAKVGMLPPKLAQTIINLAVGDKAKEPICVLDPFCGTGVLLQEATLMNYDVIGTDLEPRMVQYTVDNLSWLDSKYPDTGDYRRIEVADATSHKWDLSKVENRKSKVVVASETFLGQPLGALPNNEHLSKIIYEANLVNHKFLLNIATQIKSGTRLCLGVPTWKGKHEFLHLPLLDHLTEMGYTRVRFRHVSDNDLIYHREGQVVGRELLIIIKN